MMKVVYYEFGIFTIALIAVMFFQIRKSGKLYKDCNLFAKVLFATIIIIFIDTLGWLIDGKPICGQIWFTTIVDGLDLIFTSVVCCCWARYVLYIAFENKKADMKRYYYFPIFLLIVQITLVLSSQIFGFYYYIDEFGVYHRSTGYFIHSVISVGLLMYASTICILTYNKESNIEKRKELLFLSLIILIPIMGNIFQLYVYGYPTIWLCMVFMALAVYIHIQNSRMNKERKQQNEALKEALSQAQDANNAKSDFLSRISHDIRTPMNTIMNLSKMVETELDDKEAALSDLHKIQTSNEFLMSLVNDILDMSRIEQRRFKLTPERYSYSEFINYLHSTFDSLSKNKNIELSIEQGNLDVDIIIDKVRFNQLCFNLLSNAIKYTPQNGHVKFKMQHGELIDGQFPCDIYVIDDGIGMSEEFQKRMFEPFAQEGRAYATVEGTGLGLAIVKEIVELLGATIDINSEEGKGTNIHIHMMMIAAANEEHTKKVQFNIDRLKGCRVLVAEDHPLNQEIMQRILENAGVRVTIKNNGKEAVDEFIEHNNKYDIILMDIRMPVMDGIEATKEIRNQNFDNAKTIPIIAMTANAFADDELATKTAGMNAHLTKPVNPDMIYSTIEQYI